MPPYPGSIHRRPRSDSGAVRLMAWARGRRKAWTVPDAAEACAIAPSRARAIVRALHAGGLLEQVQASEWVAAGYTEPALWSISERGRATPDPVLVVDGATGLITGVRAASDGAGNAQLRALLDRSGLSAAAAAARLGISGRTLRRLRSGETLIAADDPVLAAARRL